MLAQPPGPGLPVQAPSVNITVDEGGRFKVDFGSEIFVVI
jgi:hypothetical protein